LSGINELYQAGKFNRFGLSNFRADEVETVIQLAKKKQFVLPTVYQGNYNPISRKQETELCTVLRKHGLAFYAYSPVAGGFLAKSKEQLLRGDAQGRWDPNTMLGTVYHALCNKPTFLDMLDEWDRIAKEAGVSKAELAYRWMAYHSGLRGDLGDAIVVGASSVDQLRQTAQGLRNGPLSDTTVGRIEKVWELVKDEAVLDNFNDWFIKQ
jgi:aflatoxin B1 aldehyde reductase